MDAYAAFVLERAKQGSKPAQLKAEPEPAPEATPALQPSPAASKSGGSKDTTPSPSTLRHAAKKAEAEMARLTDQLARIDDDLAEASVNDPSKLEGLTRARAKAQIALDEAEAAWLAAEETLAAVEAG